MAPSLMLFGNVNEDQEVLYHNMRLYGSVLCFLMGLIVYVGVKPVSKAAPLVLFCVIMSIVAIFVGIGLNWDGNDKLW